jgi:hypothetical protein
MSKVVVDDHLLRDILTEARSSDLDGLATSLATTGLWLFRLNSSWADPEKSGKLSAPVRRLSNAQQERFRAQITRLPDHIEVLHFRDLVQRMAELQYRHRSQGRFLSTAMVEALAAAHMLQGSIAVSRLDVGPNLQAAAQHDGIPFYVI